MAEEPDLRRPPRLEVETLPEQLQCQTVVVSGLQEENFPQETQSKAEALSESIFLTDVEPTEQERRSLRRVSGQIPWTAYTIAFVEMCERFSFNGTTIVFVNFIQRPLPPGSNTGAGFAGQSGALNMGQRASTALTTFSSFWTNITPLLGAYVADQYLGRFKTIQSANAVALVGYIILIISAIPSVIIHPQGAMIAFSFGVVLMGIGVGGFKSNISPLIAEQYRETQMKVVIDKHEERVIVDPVVTISRIFLYFYMIVNVGSLIGQIGMVYAEKYVGFWLSYLLPTIMFCLCPLVLYACRKKYEMSPPTGSVLAKSLKLWKLAMKGRWSWNPARISKSVKNTRDPNMWENVKPSKIAQPPAWMTFDDTWVDQVRRGLKACTVFLWYPLYWLSHRQMMNNLTSQAATLSLHGVPNDILNNLNPLSLILFIPLIDQLIYPSLRRYNIRFTPIKRIAAGFFLASCAMTVAATLQHYIYTTSPCGAHANACVDAHRPSPLSVWWQTPAYVLIGISEIFASVTGLEYAYTKAPENMRSLVMAVFLFMSAVSSAVAQAFVPLSEDPLLVWNYGVVAVLAFGGGVGFWWVFRGLDGEEDALNGLTGGPGRASEAEV
ncbi:oligopeptide transporter [Lepidopterella palustris CBS 459.81]|uniref:Oligopeptide transporter n=1 Tax=Lepidopterella palustris CBS 459.81 TaxID=1314670 RepID=A0A8E2E054_9PEZI|nr:oligopeptide transporter [Lepidopterella palustris CBS 459.81]